MNPVDQKTSVVVERIYSLLIRVKEKKEHDQLCQLLRRRI